MALSTGSGLMTKAACSEHRIPTWPFPGQEAKPDQDKQQAKGGLANPMSLQPREKKPHTYSWAVLRPGLGGLDKTGCGQGLGRTEVQTDLPKGLELDW